MNGEIRMEHPYMELYKGHLLRCEPRQTDDGQYAAHLCVSVAAPDDREDYLYDPPTPRRDSAAEAADDALVAGRAYVDRRHA